MDAAESNFQVIEFSSDDVRSRHQYKIHKIKSEFRSKIITSASADFSSGLEIPAGSNEKKSSQIFTLLQRLQRFARLGSGKANDVERKADVRS